MSNILIIGNTIKDVYLKLDTRTAHLETDQSGTAWLDLPFNNQTQNYMTRTSVFSGSITAAEVLCNFSHTVFLNDATVSYKYQELNVNLTEQPDYRYILTHEANVVYFSPSHRKTTHWRLPKNPIDWILIDNSANPDQNFIKNLNAYLTFSQNTKVALICPNQPNPIINQIAEFADLIFTSDAKLKTTGKICLITDHSITLNNTTEFYSHNRPNLTTHLCLKSIIASTIFGALINGENDLNAIKLAKINAENSTLNSTLNFTNLQDLLDKDPEKSDIRLIAKSLVTNKKGILAADESGGSIHKKFTNLNLTDNAKTRRDYRNLLFTTPNLSSYLNGIILFEETAFQTADNGQNFIDFITKQGIIPGIKVDQGLALIPNSQETYTKGLEKLDQRLIKYYQSGLRFAKWRSAFKITATTPSDYAIERNCLIMAQYAKKCQNAHIVPIIEPEILYEGDHSIEKCAETTTKVLRQLFKTLQKHSVDLSGCILKTNMILAGNSSLPSSPTKVGKYTAEVLKNNVPKSLAGIVFLSGGQTPKQATDNLAAIKQQGPFPWELTFSFSRALQDPALDSWRGKSENTTKAQNALLNRLVANTKIL